MHNNPCHPSVPEPQKPKLTAAACKSVSVKYPHMQDDMQEKQVKKSLG